MSNSKYPKGLGHSSKPGPNDSTHYTIWDPVRNERMSWNGDPNTAEVWDKLHIYDQKPSTRGPIWSADNKPKPFKP